MKWISEKEKLDKLINVDHISYEELGRRYNVSGQAVKKAAERLGLTLPKRRTINPKEHFNKGTAEMATCIYCGKEFVKYKASNGKYCSNKCQAEAKHKEYIDKWKNGEKNGLKGKYLISNAIRKYLFEKYNNSCQICGWSEVNKHTGNVPLQIHHIDGDCTNNKEENLQLLCPNCHSLTENFGRRNKNATKGRSKYFGKG
jgi:hypothetical protein